MIPDLEGFRQALSQAVVYIAKKEVIVSCGVFESPKLLMLSGIGPRDQLTQHGITSIVESPHVGQNLLDHPILSHVFKLKDGHGLDGHLLRAGPMKRPLRGRISETTLGRP